MTDPSLAIQRAVVPILRREVGLVQNRVYDRPPQDVSFPYIQYGETQIVDESVDCMDLCTAYITLHVWSRSVGKEECQRIVQQIRSSLNKRNLDLPEDGGFTWDCDELQHQSTRVLNDGDGVTTHGVIDFKTQVETLK
jgi:hypothetical protein